MKKDIENRKVEGIAIAMVPSDDPDFWDVFLINTRAHRLKNVLITSKGYGMIEEEKIETSQLRFFFEEVPAQQAVKVELINREVFQLTNEYWLSFSAEAYLYDKKYVFVQGSISELNFTMLPLIDKLGVMIK